MNIDRVKEFAEVYTSEKDVNDMLDTVSEETLRIDSRFLEPACGNGNFLVQILTRKINVIIKLPDIKLHSENIIGFLLF